MFIKAGPTPILITLLRLCVASDLSPRIPQNHQGHDLELSGSCQSKKSEYLLNQYLPLASFQLQGQVWNHDSRAVVPIADPDPPWWTENINCELVSNDIDVYQDEFIAHESVQHESPRVFEVGPDSLSTEFQPASTPLSSLNPRSDCDFTSPSSAISTSSKDGILLHESHQIDKVNISVLPSFKCPHCSTLFTSEQRVRLHIQKYHQHASKCNDCGKRFTISKDLKRHLQTSRSCYKGSARPFACKCGDKFVRKDHLLRHIARKTEKRKDGNHLAA